MLKMVGLLLLVMLASCGGGNKSGDNTNISEKMPIDSGAAIYRSASIYCSSMPGIAPFVAGGGNGKPADSLRVSIAEADGSIIKNIFFYNGSSSPEFGNGSPLNDWRSEYNELIDAMNTYPDKYVFVECGYLESRIFPEKFYLKGLYRIKDINKSDIIVSFASDILARSVKKSGGLNYDAVLNKLVLTLGGENYISPAPEVYWTRRSDTFGPKSRFAAINEAILSNAKDYVIADPTAYTEFVAGHLSGNCVNQGICALYGVGQSAVRTLNPKFASDLFGWKIEVSVNPDRIYSYSAGIDGIARAELAENKSIFDGFGSIMVSQVAEISSADFSRHSFNFEVLDVKGGTTAWIANTFASGVAGIFLCFESISNTIGCYASGVHTDMIRISIPVGNIFQIGDTDSLVYDEISNGRAIRFFSLDRLAERIPSVRKNSRQVTLVRYGFFTKESGADGLIPWKKCPQCYSSVSTNLIKVSRIN